MNYQVYDEYTEIYGRVKNSCFWKLVDTKNIEIQNLSCEMQHFFSKEKHEKGLSCNATFFFVNNIIIGIAFDHCEDVTIFGEDF